jgi:hypothetical protein
VVVALCSPSDLYVHVPRSSVPRNALLVASVSTSANTLELDGHGFATGDEVSFRAEAEGALPAPLVEGTVYYAIDVNEYTFQVAATAGGSAIDLTTTGSTVLVIPPDPVPGAIAWAEAIVLDSLPAAVLPLTEPYPPVLVTTCAELAAWKLVGAVGGVTLPLAEVLVGVQKRLDHWASGAVIRGVGAPLPASAAASSRALGAQGRARFGGIYG